MPRQRADIETMEARLDDALMDTFPASDPVSFLQPGPAREPRRSKALAGPRPVDVRAEQEVSRERAIPVAHRPKGPAQVRRRS